MSRADYDDYCDNWALIKWRGMVASSIRGKRGQSFFRALIDALDAMPEKRLIVGDLEKDGEVCALGCLGKKRGFDLSHIDPDDSDHHKELSSLFDIAECLVREVEYVNDEWGRRASPEQRWQTVRNWAQDQLKEAA